MTGFPPGIVTGTTYAATADPVSAAAQLDLGVAYTLAAAQTPTVSGVSAFANQTLIPGVYNAGSSLSISGTVTLDGNGQSNPAFLHIPFALVLQHPASTKPANCDKGADSTSAAAQTAFL